TLRPMAIGEEHVAPTTKTPTRTNVGRRGANTAVSPGPVNPPASGTPDRLVVLPDQVVRGGLPAPGAPRGNHTTNRGIRLVRYRQESLDQVLGIDLAESARFDGLLQSCRDHPQRVDQFVVHRVTSDLEEVAHRLGTEFAILQALRRQR